MNLVLRKVLTLGVFCLSIILFAYLGATSNQSSNQLTPSIRIAVSQTPLSSPFIVAKSNQYFLKQGLNIEIVPCFGGVACAELLFSGEVDYATASESVVMFQSFKRKDFRVLASFVESTNDLKLLALKEQGITKTSDLDGKKVGIVKASASEFYLDSLLIVDNLKRIEISKVYMAPQEMEKALTSNQVDAISVWEPYGYLLENATEEPPVNLGIAGVYTLSFNLLAMGKTVDADPQVATSILLALGDAINWMHQNSDTSRALVSQALDVPLEQLEWSWNDYVFRLSLGNSLLSNLQLQARWATNSGLTSGVAPDYRKIMHAIPLNDALKTEAF